MNLIAWIEKNVITLIGWAAVAFAGFVGGQSTTEARLTVLEATVATNNGQLLARRSFMACSIRIMDQVTEATGVKPRCNLQAEGE